MKPGDQTPQNWQQPPENLSQAPYQAPNEQPYTPSVTPPPAQTGDTNPAPTYQQTPVEQPSYPENYSNENDDANDDVRNEEIIDDNNSDEALLRWQATEYLHHERTMIWYVILGVVVAAFIALAILVFHSVTFAILIPVMLVALVVYVKRPPSVLNYILSRKGLHVNDHLYTYDQFKAFGIVTHDDLHSVVLLPRKRFQVSQTVYFPEEVGEPLVDMLAARLPMQEVQLDAIDRLLKKLRI